MKLRHDFDIFDSHVLLLARTTKEWKQHRRATVRSLAKAPTGLGMVNHSIWSPTDGMDGGIHFFTVFIDVERHSSRDLLVNTIAHESAHAALAILESTKASYDSSTEPMAYLVGFIAQWLYERCEPLLTPGQG